MFGARDNALPCWLKKQGQIGRACVQQHMALHWQYLNLA